MCQDVYMRPSNHIWRSSNLVLHWSFQYESTRWNWTFFMKIKIGFVLGTQSWNNQSFIRFQFRMFRLVFSIGPLKVKRHLMNLEILQALFQWFKWHPLLSNTLIFMKFRRDWSKDCGLIWFIYIFPFLSAMRPTPWAHQVDSWNQTPCSFTQFRSLRLSAVFSSFKIWLKNSWWWAFTKKKSTWCSCISFQVRILAWIPATTWWIS